MFFSVIIPKSRTQTETGLKWTNQLSLIINNFSLEVFLDFIDLFASTVRLFTTQTFFVRLLSLTHSKLNRLCHASCSQVCLPNQDSYRSKSTFEAEMLSLSHTHTGQYWLNLTKICPSEKQTSLFHRLHYFTIQYAG